MPSPIDKRLIFFVRRPHRSTAADPNVFFFFVFRRIIAIAPMHCNILLPRSQHGTIAGSRPIICKFQTQPHPAGFGPDTTSEWDFAFCLPDRFVFSGDG